MRTIAAVLAAIALFELPSSARAEADGCWMAIVAVHRPENIAIDIRTSPISPIRELAEAFACIMIARGVLRKSKDWAEKKCAESEALAPFQQPLPAASKVNGMFVTTVIVNACERSVK